MLKKKVDRSLYADYFRFYLVARRFLRALLIIGPKEGDCTMDMGPAKYVMTDNGF